MSSGLDFLSKGIVVKNTKESKSKKKQIFMNDFLLITISFFFLLSIASFSLALFKKTNFPHTVILFVLGVLMALAIRVFPVFSYLSGLEFSKDLVFFVFLPILIFESAYNIPYKKLIKDSVPITALAVFSLLISTLLIGIFLKLALNFFGFLVPYSICILFGAIISATDPVAVLSIFKELGVPKRISYIFEGESIFNDGTALALFLIIFELILSGDRFSLVSLSQGVWTFLSMIIGGVVLGLVLGLFFSKSIQYMKDSWAELTLTLILAHTTFILAELISSYSEHLKISGIIATAVAALTLGTYGRYKISKQVREMMDVTWGYFAFVSNSLIFLLMGLMIGSMKMNISHMILPIVLAIVVVIIARALSVVAVTAPLNLVIRHKLPWKWQALLAWGSLRGAIAITMLLFIPEDFFIPGWSFGSSPREFISVLVIACVVFTLLIKVATVKKMILKLGIGDLSKEDEFTLHQLKEIIDKSILGRLNDLENKRHIAKDISNILKSKYSQDILNENKELDKYELNRKEFKNLLSRYALGVERRTVIEAFESKQIDEGALNRILNKIENQYIRIEEGLSQVKSEEEKEELIYRFKEKVKLLIKPKKDDRLFRRNYIYFRSRALIAEEVIQQLALFQKNFYSNKNYDNCFKEVIEQYQQWKKEATKKKNELIARLKKSKTIDIDRERSILLNKHLIYLENELIDKLYSKHIMSGRIKRILENNVWEGEKD